VTIGGAPPVRHGAAKRALDLLVAVPALVLLAPLIAAIALLVRLDSTGPALFRQQRGGRGGRAFELLKFRTMVVGADRQWEALLAHSRDPHWLLLDEDPRVTRVGRVLRATSLDELPQLWNVIRGEMSLVGPRPLPLAEDVNVPAWGIARRHVPPGMTGPWQVHGRTTLSFEQMVALDCQYAERVSLRRDVALLLRTVPAALLGRGAN
jgi:lipopolysaccharide/colanic/teichoic acid biosynthesis glycosyltransferase